MGAFKNLAIEWAEARTRKMMERDREFRAEYNDDPPPIEWVQCPHCEAWHDADQAFCDECGADYVQVDEDGNLLDDGAEELEREFAAEADFERMVRAEQEANYQREMARGIERFDRWTGPF